MPIIKSKEPIARVPFNTSLITRNPHCSSVSMFDDLAHTLGHLSEGLDRGSISTHARDHITEATDNLLDAILAIRAAAGCTTQGH